MNYFMGEGTRLTSKNPNLFKSVRTSTELYVQMVKSGNDKFTISVDRTVKEKFKQLCEEQGLAPGKQIELLLKKKIKELEGEQ